MYFLEWKSSYFDLSFTGFCSQVSNSQLVSIGSDNGLVLNSWQAIIWTSAHPVHWSIYVALGGDESTLQVLVPCIYWTQSLSSLPLQMPWHHMVLGHWQAKVLTTKLNMTSSTFWSLSWAITTFQSPNGITQHEQWNLKKYYGTSRVLTTNNTTIYNHLLSPSSTSNKSIHCLPILLHVFCTNHLEMFSPKPIIQSRHVCWKVSSILRIFELAPTTPNRRLLAGSSVSKHPIMLCIWPCY